MLNWKMTTKQKEMISKTLNDKKEDQTKLPGADTTRELLDKANKLEKDKSKR